jgi:AcrR family transcriptional regulator
MLGSSPYRDVTVIDVARSAGTSPATFYQYFPDIESAIIELANEMAKDGARLRTLAEDQQWSGKSGYAAAEALVDGFLTFWQQHDAILRVVDLASAEGDKRFYKIRMKILNAVTTSIADAISELQKTGRIDQDVHPMAMAGVLVAMLASVSAHQKGFETWNIRVKDLHSAMAGVVYWGVTQRRPAH